MKKAWVVLLILLFAVPCMAEEYAETSGELSATGIVYNGECFVTGVQVITNAAASATVILYDALSTDGKVVVELGALIAAQLTNDKVFIPPIRMNTGIYAVISGASASYIVEYKRR